ncbi:MAG: FAD-dependent oxidoreductase [Clostridia bacterium]|nr:FAD-dependent oxidoreductase [Clostridia bacterium]
MEKYELIVVGGGFAGTAAAIAAAREGIRVLLIEKSNCLGGAATGCLVNPFMCYWTETEQGRLDLARGIFQEICRRLERRNALVRGQSFLEEELKYVLQEMVLESGAKLLLRADLFRVNREEGRVVSLELATRGGPLTLTADCFIDATGDAQLAYLADCPTVLGRASDHLCQPMTLCFRVGNVDTERFYASYNRLKAAHAKSLAAGELTNPRENILVFSFPAENVLHFNTTRVVKKNPTDPFDVTEAEILGRRQVHEIYDFMKKHADGLENSFLMMTAAEIGVRESRRIEGDYTLTEADCKACVRFEDAVVACNYEIDIHNPEGTGTSLYYFNPGEYYTIPYRCLIPKGVNNLLTAGRCISSDHAAQASYRVMPTVCCLGEAAGTAAALAIQIGSDTRQVNVKTLQSVLRAHGAFIG